MTQNKFYNWAHDVVDEGQGLCHKHERLVKDLRDSNYSWTEITEIFALMYQGPYGKDW